MNDKKASFLTIVVNIGFLVGALACACIVIAKACQAANWFAASPYCATFYLCVAFSHGKLGDSVEGGESARRTGSLSRCS